MPQVNSDTILDWLKQAVTANKKVPNEAWLDAALKLNILLADEHIDLENYRSIVSNKKLVLLKEQEKRNVAAAQLEIEASDEYRELKLQEHRVDRIEEFIRLAKINAKSGLY